MNFLCFVKLIMFTNLYDRIFNKVSISFCVKLKSAPLTMSAVLGGADKPNK